MSIDREGDGLDSLLRATLEQSTVPHTACPDAEMVAAWHEGVLSRADAQTVERHVADCARCRALAAGLIRSEPPVAQPVVPLWRRWRLQWVVPLAATASAVALWVAVPSRDQSRSASGAATGALFRSGADAEPGERRETADAQGQQQEVVAPPSAARIEARSTETPSQQKASSENADLTRPTAPVDRLQSTLPAAAPAPATAPLRQSSPASGEPAQAAPSAQVPSARLDALEMPAGGRGGADRSSRAQRIRLPIEIASPDPAVRWRVLPGAVEVSRTGGAQWGAAVLPDAASADAVTAGNAPDGQTCWLVGREGLVLRSTDAVMFARVPFLTMVDLIGVRAEDRQRATVTAADGRLFETTDGGSSWTGRR